MESLSPQEIEDWLDNADANLTQEYLCNEYPGNMDDLGDGSMDRIKIHDDKLHATISLDYTLEAYQLDDDDCELLGLVGDDVDCCYSCSISVVINMRTGDVISSNCDDPRF